MKVGIYLCGHGPYRNPRLIEMQYLRIMRYHSELQERHNYTMRIMDTYVDINYKRSNYMEDYPNLIRLNEDINGGKINTVLLDLKIGRSFNLDENYFIIKHLENAGVKIYNYYYDEEEIMLPKLTKTFGNKVNYCHLPNDAEEIIALFPKLASRIVYEVLEEVLEQKHDDDGEVIISDIRSEIKNLSEKNPYIMIKLPWITDKMYRRLLKLKREGEKNL